MSKSPFFELKGAGKRMVEYLYKYYYPKRRKFEKQNCGAAQETGFKNEVRPLLDKQKVWVYIFPDQDFDGRRFRSMLSEVKALLEKYFAYKAVFGEDKAARNVKGRKSIFLEREDEIKLTLEIEKMNFFMGRGEWEQVSKRYQKCWAFLEKKNQIDERWFEFAYKLKEIYNDLIIRRLRKDDQLTEMSNYLDRFYIMQKLKAYSAMATRAQIFDIKYEYPLMENLLSGSLSSHLEPSSVEKIYSGILKALLGPVDEIAIKRLWQLVLQHQAQISDIPLKQIAAFIRVNLQFLKKRGGENVIPINRLIFQITKFMDKRNILGINGSINHTQFVATIKTSLAARELRWTICFIDREAPNLTGEFASHSIIYARAYLEFLKGNYLSAWKLLENINFDSRNFQIQIRCLKLKMLYRLLEQDDSFFADSCHILGECESFRKMVSEDKTYTSGRKKRMRNFISNTKRFVRMKEGKFLSPRELQKTKDGIFRDPVEDKEWILEVLNEFL